MLRDKEMNHCKMSPNSSQGGIVERYRKSKGQVLIMSEKRPDV